MVHEATISIHNRILQNLSAEEFSTCGGSKEEAMLRASRGEVRVDEDIQHLLTDDHARNMLVNTPVNVSTSACRAIGKLTKQYYRRTMKALCHGQFGEAACAIMNELEDPRLLPEQAAKLQVFKRILVASAGRAFSELCDEDMLL